VHVRHRVAIHGFALNVTTPPEAFAEIVPCGLRDTGVTSIAQLRGSAPTLEALAVETAGAFGRSFGAALRPSEREFDL
jgi:lipoyl(octanoyl) transferase